MRALEAQYCASDTRFVTATKGARCGPVRHAIGECGMTPATDDERRLALLLADRLGLTIPPAALDGVVANQRLLARHHAAVREDAR